MKFFAAILFSLALVLTGVALAADEEQVPLEIKIQLVEMPPGAAIAGGFLDAKAIEAGQEGGIRISLHSAESNPTALSLEQLVEQGSAHVLASAVYGVANGMTVDFAQMIDAPFALQDEARIEDEPAAELDYPGQLGYAVRVEPTADDKGLVLLKITTISRVAQTYSSAGSEGTTEKHRVNRGGMMTAMKLKRGTTISIADAMFEEDRRDLSDLPGMAELATQQPFFAPPTLGWVLYLLITPSIIEDQ